MSLIHKRKMTGKNLAAHRRNGPKSQGAVTPAGKARAAKANLRHGFYSQARNQAMTAVGEDPADYARLLNSVVDSLQPAAGLEGELVKGMVGSLWRMQRAERVQDGAALKRVQRGWEVEQLLAAPKMLRIHEVYEGLCAIARMLNREDSTPVPGEIQALVAAFGVSPPDNVRKVFPFLLSYGEAASQAPGPANQDGDNWPHPLTAARQEREAACQKLNAAIDAVIMPYARSSEMQMEEYEKIQSPENIAALMAPRDKNALLLQRMEDSNLRQFWRFINILVKVRKGTLA